MSRRAGAGWAARHALVITFAASLLASGCGNSGDPEFGVDTSAVPDSGGVLDADATSPSDAWSEPPVDATADVSPPDASADVADGADAARESGGDASDADASFSPDALADAADAGDAASDAISEATNDAAPLQGASCDGTDVGGPFGARAYGGWTWDCSSGTCTCAPCGLAAQVCTCAAGNGVNCPTSMSSSDYVAICNCGACACTL